VSRPLRRGPVPEPGPGVKEPAQAAAGRSSVARRPPRAEPVSASEPR
jgi:hypothetical protein